jgi:hypothetical protein
MTTSDVQPAAPQPGNPGNEWATPPAQEEKKSGAKKWAAVAGTVAVVGVGAAYSLTGGFGMGDPKVGDCVQMVGETDFEAVGCDDAEAEAKIVGIDEQEMTRTEFDEAGVEDICVDFATTEVALWIGDMITEPGTIYCAAGV